MDLVSLLTIALLAFAPQSAGTASQMRLMDEIEAALPTPLLKKHRSLAEYSRNYAFADGDRVVAVYVLPRKPIVRGPDYGCLISDGKGPTRPCTRAEIDESIAAEARTAAWHGAAGQRRWFADRRMLPDISDGGCTVITIEYHVPSHSLLLAECNGVG